MYSYTGSIHANCVDGIGHLAVYPDSKPQQICLTMGSVLTITLPDVGGEQFLTPTVRGHAINLTGGGYVDGHAQLTLYAQRSGRSIVNTTIGGPVGGSEAPWYLVVRVQS
jgi:hypothetical protein